MRFNRLLSVPTIAIALTACGCATGTDQGIVGSPPSQSTSGGNANGFDVDAGALPQTDPGLPITPYAAGAIIPSGDRAAINAAALDAYAAWKAKFLVEGCDGMYVDMSREPPPADRRMIAPVTSSELHGMAMVATAQLGDQDPDARGIFDKLFAYYRAHPSAGSPDLMASTQVAGCVNAAEGTFSSTDGDADIAYALLVADLQWGSAGAINYAEEARRVMSAIQSHDIDSSTRLAMFGDWVVSGFRREGQAARSSHFLIDHFRVFGAVTGDAFWQAAVDAHWSTVTLLQDRYAQGTGLLPDYIATTHTSPEPAGSNWFEGITDPWFAAHASRVPLRLGIDWLVSGDKRAQSALQRINQWIRTKTSDDPKNISAGYRLDGSLIAVSVINDNAFVAPFGVAAMCNVANQPWLDAIWNHLRTSSVETESVYASTTRVLSMITMSGNWIAAIPGASASH